MPMRSLKLLFALTVFAVFPIGGSVFAQVLDSGVSPNEDSGSTPTRQNNESDYDEELTVTATRLEKGDVPTAEIMSATYDLSLIHI